MTKRLIILLCILTGYIGAYADSQTDRLMSQVIRDTNTYIAADVRAETEDKAYEQAMALLSEKIGDYFKENNKDMPDAVFLSNISNHSERLISQTGANRCRVVVYVKKRDLIPVGDGGNSVMLAKNDNDSYTMVTSSAAQKAAASSNTGTSTVKQTTSPVLARIAAAKTSKEVQSLLVEFKKANSISGAAAFPIASANDFYVVAIDRSETPAAILHYSAGNWTNVSTGENVNIDSYKYCTAYWLTLP